MPKNSLKSKVEGNELDLSFSELKEVPVRELAAIPKATHLDLSCNLLTSLQPNFCSLTHLIKLDLSKNQLEELPVHFGKLTNLQTLDLYSNQLKVLPESFHELKKLKWLDLKNNPLNPQLSSVAGDCLDEKQCQTCAKQVIEFMEKVHLELEKQREKVEKLKKDKEAAKLAAEERKKEKQRLAKKAAKEKRKAEFLNQKLLQQQQEKEQLPPKPMEHHHNGIVQDTVTKENFNVKQRRSCLFWMMAALVAIIGILIAVFFVALSRDISPPYQNITVQLLYDKGTLVLEEGLSHAKQFGNYTVYFADYVVKFTASKVNDVIVWLKNENYF